MRPLYAGRFSKRWNKRSAVVPCDEADAEKVLSCEVPQRGGRRDNF